MNRREFLAAGFKLGAAGLLLPAIEPIRRYWSLDRTMVPGPIVTFTGSGPSLVGDPFVAWAKSHEEWVVYWGLAKTLDPHGNYTEYLYRV